MGSGPHLQSLQTIPSAVSNLLLRLVWRTGVAKRLTGSQCFGETVFMPKALEEVTKAAMALPPRQKLALAGFLLESADDEADPEAEAAWDSEIADRIRAVDEGHVAGVPYEEVMREAERRLAP